MDSDKKSKLFIVIFMDKSIQNLPSRVQCVPRLWIIKSDEPGFVNVYYPPHALDIETVLKCADDFPSVEWSFYKAKIIHAAINTKDALEKLASYRSTADVLQNEVGLTPNIKNEVETQKRKLEDSMNDSRNIATTSKQFDWIDLDTPTLTGFQDVNEARLNTTIKLDNDDEEDDQNERSNDVANVSTIFKELRNRISLTLHEIQSQFDPNYKNPECDVEINQDESINQQNLKTIIDIDSTHLNFTAPGLNVVELMTDTGVYVQKLRLDYIDNCKDKRQIVGILLKAIFTEESLQNLTIGQMNQQALLVLYLFMLQRYRLNMEETREIAVKFLKSNKRQNKNVLKPKPGMV